MLTVLLGLDIFAKQQYLDKIIAQFNLEILRYQNDQDLPKLSSLGGNNLFGNASLYVFSNCLKNYELPELEAAQDSLTQIIFLEDALDKRLTKSKKILEIAEVQEFLEPLPANASKWILSHSEAIGINIQPSAAIELAARLIGENRSTLPVINCHHELLKLFSFSNHTTITTEMVKELTPKDLNIDLFGLLDSIATHNRSKAIEMLSQYYESSGEDDKALTIRLTALLSDQLRSMLITKQLLDQGLSDKDILQATTWKTGRLYIMKKLSNNFCGKQLESALTKLYSLDKELKSSTLPPRVIIDMIVAML